MGGLILGKAVEWVAAFFENKKEVAKARADAKIQNVNQHLSGYSDEFLLLVWSYPFVSMFIPVLRADTFAAFDAMGGLPEWYVGGFIAVTFSVFGIDKIFKYKKVSG